MYQSEFAYKKITNFEHLDFLSLIEQLKNSAEPRFCLEEAVHQKSGH